MSKIILALCIYFISSQVSAQTIGQLLTQNINGGTGFTAITKTAALVSQNPAWDTNGTKTLIISTASLDVGLAGYNGSGFLFTDQIALNWQTAAKVYNVLHDVTENPIAVYDNYNSGFTLHFRTGMEDLVALQYLTASNGFIYILNAPLRKLFPITSVITNNVNQLIGSYGALIAKAGLTDTVNNLSGVTFLIPNDAAITSAQAQLNALTTSQLRYVIANHILSVALYSNLFGTNPYTNILGLSLTPLTSTNAAGETTNKLGNASFVLPNDLTTLNGPGQTIDTVLIPASFPAGADFPTTLVGHTLSAAVTTAPATTSASTSTIGVKSSTTSSAVITTSAAAQTTAAKSSSVSGKNLSAGAFITALIFAMLA
ncbi:hypothetical protein HK096_005895 [Nowakowskiella sp. JEL0078]|nr:hypothetical protein HK096_005895 [Nowakowskiella sp. JEL0078]